MSAVKSCQSLTCGWEHVALVFVDQMRVGLISNFRRVWGVRGESVRVPYQAVYEWSYLWLAADPIGGQLQALWTPYVDKQISRVFLEQLRAAWSKTFIILVWDQAGWHRVEEVPEGISLVPLTPYSPELNPMERLIEELRQATANRVWPTLEAKMDVIEKELRAYFQDSEKTKRLLGYPWIQKQWSKIYEIIS